MIGKQPRPAIVAYADLIGILFAAQRRRGKSRADLNTLDGIDAHQSRGEIAVELAVNRRTETNGYAFRDNLDDRTDEGAALANVVEVALEELCVLRIRQRERVALDAVPVPQAAIDDAFAQRHQRD